MGTGRVIDLHEHSWTHPGTITSDGCIYIEAEIDLSRQRKDLKSHDLVN